VKVSKLKEYRYIYFIIHNYIELLLSKRDLTANVKTQQCGAFTWRNFGTPGEWADRDCVHATDHRQIVGKTTIDIGLEKIFIFYLFSNKVFPDLNLMVFFKNEFYTSPSMIGGVVRV
jgi:hypothetical protein